MLLTDLQHYRIFLASKSPRRRDLLAGMGIMFGTAQSDEPEQVDSDWSAEEVVCQLSQRKAEAVFRKISAASLPQSAPLLVIGGDTIVVSDGQILGKPKDREESLQMLRQLSGKSHIVYSGICVKTAQTVKTAYDTTTVTFESVKEEELVYYVDNYQPFDKAGSYGVQEWIGYRGISGINGSFYTVMGLPTHLLWRLLETTLHH